MIVFLWLIFAKIVFFAVLVALRVKSFTTHFCFVRRAWRFEKPRAITTEGMINGKKGFNTVLEFYLGPVAFVVVR